MIDWAKHGICGRGVLLDLVLYYTESDADLPYDPFTSHPISVAELEACAKKQGVEFRSGDILILRVGFIRKYNTVTNEERAALGSKEETLYVICVSLFSKTEYSLPSAGIEQSEDMKRFLWCESLVLCCSHYPDNLECRDNHFAAVASDQPALEVCPHQDLPQTLLIIAY